MINFLKNCFKNYFIIILLFLILLASSYSLIHRSFFHIHDFTHATRIAEMARALDDGQFPVRWSENLGYGFGMPLFNFYAPLPYFIGALFLKLGSDAVTSIKLLYLLSNTVTLLGAYLLGKKMFGRHGGLLLAGAYTLAPYRALNLFVRGALSEAFAMAFLPWVLWAIISFVKKQDKKYLLILIISIFSIILSHNLTAMIFIPMAALFVFVYLLWQKKLVLLWPIAGSFLLAILLSAFYILPAFLEKDLTAINSIFSGYFYYSNHFLYIRQFFQDNWQYGGSAWGPDDDISFFLGKGQLFGLLILTGGLVLAFFKNWKKTLQSSLFFLTVTFSSLLMLSLFMTLLKSQLLWDQFPILQYIQFPWRFLSTASFFLALLLAISAYAPNKGWPRNLYSGSILAILLFNFAYFKPQSYLDDANALYYTDSKLIQTQMSETLPDYIPKQMASQKILQQANQELPLVWLENNAVDGQVEMMFDHGFEKMALVGAKNETLLNFKVANFAGWQASIDGELSELQSGQLGNIQVRVPTGEHKVSLNFGENTPARIWGDCLSILALLITFYCFSPFAKEKNS